jgi:hypothetical protein
MKESIKHLEKEKGKLVDERNDVYDALYPIENFYRNREIPKCAEETLVLLKQKYDELNEQIKGFSKAIEGFQSVCSHKHEDGSKAMIYDGHDSHKTYYKCTICGYEDDY